MAEVSLHAGAKLDLLNRDEVKDVLDVAMTSWRKELARGVRFRAFSGRATVVGGAWQMLPTDADDNILGPNPGMVWSVTTIAVSGGGILGGTDRFGVYIDDISPTKLVVGRILDNVLFDVGALVIDGASKLALAGAGTGAGTVVWMSGRAVELPVQLAWQLL